ncbi:MAG: exonuclease domain-containing protein [Janthinobacterium lividum]
MPALKSPPRSMPRLAFVDLETTGGNATVDRITEVGIIEVDEQGNCHEWSSLVNPQAPIPDFIQGLTGITNDMVAGAPLFSELADEVQRRLDGCIFIAHNARFDHGFLKNEFKRTGHEFRPSVLCTVRLSRKLFPGFGRHNLDAISERHKLEVTERHRALGDARLIWQFWNKLLESHQPELLMETVNRLLSRPSLPSRLEGFQIETLPTSAGVYLFYGAADAPLYVGKAVNLRRRVLSHFSGDHASDRELELSQQIERIEWRETSGELGALLLEARLVKQLAPAFNRQLRENDTICAWRLVKRRGRLQVMLTDLDDLFFGYDEQLIGLFSSVRKARQAIRSIADAHALCWVMLGLEKQKTPKPCFASQVGKCLGVCAERESVDEHNARMEVALAGLRLQAWPYQGAIAIRENESLHVLDGWTFVGQADSEDQARLLLQKGRGRFDRDVYKILRAWLPRMSAAIIELR